MKKAKKVALTLLLIVSAIFLMGQEGCEAERAPVEKGTPVLRNDLDVGFLELRHVIPGERFDFVTRYSTKYSTAAWRITDYKSIRMEARIAPVSSGWLTATTPTVFVEHVHVDCSIQSMLPGVDGLPQDSMDDKLHTGEQIGFWVTDEYPYENVFIIEGYSKTLIDGWGFVAGGTGVYGLKEERLTENNLVKEGKAYASKIQVVYDLAIRYPGEEYFHTRSIVDEILVPVPGAGKVLEE